MGESILTSIKTQLALMPEDESFDEEIISDINAAFATLTQLGVGPQTGFVITGYNETWDDYVVDIVQAQLAQDYVKKTVRATFDPPNNATVLNKMYEQIAQLEWILKVQAEV